MNKNKLIIALDFDGTVIKKCDFPCLKYEFKKDAKEVINYLHNKGVVFILNTARYTWYRWPAFIFIWKNKLPIKINVFNKKPDADIYIDDKNLECENIDWIKIKENIEKRLEE